MTDPDATTGRGPSRVAALAVIAAVALLAGAAVYLGTRDDTSSGGAGDPGEAPKQAAGSVAEGDTAWDVARAREELAALTEMLMNINEQSEPMDAMVRAARRLVERYPKFAEGRAFFGQVLMLAGQTGAAIEQYHLSLDLDRQQPATHLLLGTLYLQTERPVEAAKAFDQAVSLEPGNASYRLHLAQAHLELDEMDKARRAFLEVIRHTPDAHQAYSGLADLYLEQNKTGLAVTQYDRAIEHVSDEQPQVKTLYRRKKAAALRRANDPEAALLVLQNIPFASRQSPDIIEEMATCWAMLGKPERGADLFKTALAMDPVNVDLLAGAIRWYDKADNPEQRDRFARTLERADPDHPALQ